MANLKLSFDEYIPLRDIVFKTLREAIVTGELKPGERLMEIKLANEMGVSRTPVREAFRQLELEGLITIIPNRGAYVTGIKVKDIQDKRDTVIQLLGKQGRMIVDLASGIDDRKVIPYRPEDAKSISREMTFQEDVADYEFLKHALLLLSISVERRARRVGLHGKGVVLKLTYANMKSITRSKILPEADHAITIYREAVRLLDHVQHDPVRLVGVGIYNLTGEEYEQLVLEGFEPEQAGNPENELEKELRRLQSIYLIDFAGHLEQIYHGETLYKTIEYMRKKKR